MHQHYDTKFGNKKGPTHSQEDQHHHQNALWDCACLIVLIPSKEEECTETDLLDVHAHEYMLHGFRVEQASGVRGRWLGILIQEEIFEELVEQEEGKNSETVDDGRDDGVPESYTNH